MEELTDKDIQKIRDSIYNFESKYDNLENRAKHNDFKILIRETASYLQQYINDEEKCYNNALEIFKKYEKINPYEENAEYREKFDNKINNVKQYSQKVVNSFNESLDAILKSMSNIKLGEEIEKNSKDSIANISLKNNSINIILDTQSKNLNKINEKLTKYINDEIVTVGMIDDDKANTIIFKYAKEIEPNAIRNCNNLKLIVINKGVKKININAFRHVNFDVIIAFEDSKEYIKSILTSDMFLNGRSIIFNYGFNDDSLKKAEIYESNKKRNLRKNALNNEKQFDEINKNKIISNHDIKDEFIENEKNNLNEENLDIAINDFSKENNDLTSKEIINNEIFNESNDEIKNKVAIEDEINCENKQSDFYLNKDFNDNDIKEINLLDKKEEFEFKDNSINDLVLKQKNNQNKEDFKEINVISNNNIVEKDNFEKNNDEETFSEDNLNSDLETYNELIEERVRALKDRNYWLYSKNLYSALEIAFKLNKIDDSLSIIYALLFLNSSGYKMCCNRQNIQKQNINKIYYHPKLEINFLNLIIKKYNFSEEYLSNGYKNSIYVKELSERLKYSYYSVDNSIKLMFLALKSPNIPFYPSKCEIEKN